MSWITGTSNERSGGGSEGDRSVRMELLFSLALGWRRENYGVTNW